MSGKVALITGSGRKRVGNVIARSLARKGWSIALHYHSSADAAEETKRELEANGVACDAFQADVTSESEVSTLVDEAVERFGRLDAAITTSSIWAETTFEDVTASDLKSNFDVNAVGTFLVGRAAGRVMVDQPDGGCIVTIGDWAIERPYLDHSAYLISKGTIPTITRVLAVELGHRNPKVRVNGIHPGPVMFPPETAEEEKRQLIESTLLKQADCPDMVASAVEFLIENTFVTGHCIPVDGGRHMFSVSDLRRK